MLTSDGAILYLVIPVLRIACVENRTAEKGRAFTTASIYTELSSWRLTEGVDDERNELLQPIETVHSWKGFAPPSLARIEKKDFGTIQSLPPLKRNPIFDQLREIYDGQSDATFDICGMR